MRPTYHEASKLSTYRILNRSDSTMTYLIPPRSPPPYLLQSHLSFNCGGINGGSRESRLQDGRAGQEVSTGNRWPLNNASIEHRHRYPLQYHTIPYLTLFYRTLPYPTLRHATESGPTLPYRTLPYPTLPYPTLLPYPSLHLIPTPLSHHTSYTITMESMSVQARADCRTCRTAEKV